MNKKTVLSVMGVSMLFAISLYFVGGTYARYVSAFDGTATVDIAKWAVALKAGGTDATAEESFTLALTPKENDDVVKDKFAPATEATGTLEVDLAGTEVAVEIKAEVDEDAVKEALATAGLQDLTDHDITITAEATGAEDMQVTGDGITAPIVVQLPGGTGAKTAFTATHKVTITLTAEWDNASDTHNPTHTQIGEKAATAGELKLEIPVKLHVVQHITDQEYTIPSA